MRITEQTAQKRENRTIEVSTDLLVAGGGIAGCCAAITAARKGIKVVLIQDRPVLGGNASSEVRLWILGATSHMGNNNRWSREGGVIDEILIENLYRNKEGNTLILDTILLEKVIIEPNITLLLNTAVFDLEKTGNAHIKSLRAFCSQNSTTYNIKSTLFCDSTGDGIVSFLAGAAFRMGAENKEEFGEALAPTQEYGELLGHSLYFYSKRSDKPVKYLPPAFSLKDIKEIPRFKVLNQNDYGCRLWWIEYGGRRDTVHDTEEIKWELWKVVYGIWDHIKNSGQFENVDDLTLEWVGTIPGKRESRRFEGLYMLKQQDVIQQRHFDDAVAFGGWALDLHPADGIYSPEPGCNQYHSKGIYGIPYRSFVSQDIDNLFFAGRIISTSHVAFSSSRVMATCGHGAQAVGIAAALCIQHQVKPAMLLEPNYLKELQEELNIAGQSIPGLPITRRNTKIDLPSVSASSTLKLSKIPPDGGWLHLTIAEAQLLPLTTARYTFKIKIKATTDTTLKAELRCSVKKTNYTPEQSIQLLEIPVKAMEQEIELIFTEAFPVTAYGFLILHKNDAIQIKLSNFLYTGITTVCNGKNKAVSNNGSQQVSPVTGVESFEFWIPRRRPDGHNIGMEIYPALEPYQAAHVQNGYTRPFLSSNAWAADPNDPAPMLTFKWDKPQTIQTITLYFDTDFDHALESSLYGHPESVIPFCIREYTIFDKSNSIIYSLEGNHQTINKIVLDRPLETDVLYLQVKHPANHVPAAIYEVLFS
ncbi:FAD-dependent oxidoreductase [Pedobacter immunditicola]|uniref:FAD-dependent oxidoreductase n=1 Tax=Pedobacter immunditicola TaxID=3133440 RepID=UPI0030A4DB6B